MRKGLSDMKNMESAKSIALVSAVLVLYLGIPHAGMAKDESCSRESFASINRLYENESIELIESLFSTLDCGGELADPSKRGPYVAMVGGLMQQHPEWIEILLESTTNSANLTASKICIDGLWFCGTDECRARLKKRPFQLPKEDVENLLQEPPPNVEVLPIQSEAALDVMWYYFIATGDAVVPRRIFEFLRDNSSRFEEAEEEATEFILLYGAARWSFLSMAEQHQRVREVLTSNAPTSKEAQAMLAELEQ